MTSRREFLGTAGRLGLGAAAVLASRAASAPGPALGAASRTIHLEARKTMWELSPGRTIKAIAYNDRIPGPEIRAREGERLRIVLTNALEEPTTVHWHGVDVPNPMDGVPGVTQRPVQPGATFVYEFEARPAGTRWYHTHFQEHRQMDLGLVAPLIIEPASAEPFPFDREHTLVLDDWATGTGPALPSTQEGTAGGRGGMGGIMGSGRMMRGTGMMGGMMERGAMGGMMSSGHGPAYDVMTINGRAYPATEPIRVRKGGRLRLRLINASAEHTHVLRLAGHRLRITHTDGNPLASPAEVDALPIAPSERYDVLVMAERPGAWFLQCLAPGHAEAGERLVLLYDGARGEPEEPGRDLAGLVFWRYGLGRGRDVLPRASGGTHEMRQVLSGGMMGSDLWTINGKRFPDTDPITALRGERVRLRFDNRSMEAHPMHLHGQSFRVLAVNGAALAAPLVKDSVDVEAHMGTVDIEFTAHNPGDWLLHCHKPMHMDGGMATLVKVRES